MSKYNIVCNETRYDKDGDSLVTTGKMNFNGEPSTFEFEEKDGRYCLSVQSKDFEIFGHNKNFPSVSGEGLSHPAVQQFLKNPDEIHNAIEAVVEEFQQNNHDARIAILNYAEPEIGDYDIDATDIKRNQGDIGEFYGKLRVESEMLRFTADRDDGEVHLTQIALLGEPMEDPRTFGFTDNMMAKVVEEVDRGIDEFERQEAIDKALSSTEHDADERSADEPER
jgi:hypothetical protein